MIEDDLLQFLKSRGEIAVLTGPRIRPGKLRTSDTNGAAIRMAKISTPSEYDLSGPSGIVGTRFQLDCYSKDYREVHALALLVFKAMPDFRGPHSDDVVVRTVTRESESDSTEKIQDGSDDVRHRVRQDWLVWHTEAVPA